MKMDDYRRSQYSERHNQRAFERLERSPSRVNSRRTEKRRVERSNSKYRSRSKERVAGDDYQRSQYSERHNQRAFERLERSPSRVNSRRTEKRRVKRSNSKYRSRSKERVGDDDYRRSQYCERHNQRAFERSERSPSRDNSRRTEKRRVERSNSKYRSRSKERVADDDYRLSQYCERHNQRAFERSERSRSRDNSRPNEKRRSNSKYRSRSKEQVSHHQGSDRARGDDRHDVHHRYAGFHDLNSVPQNTYFDYHSQYHSYMLDLISNAYRYPLYDHRFNPSGIDYQFPFQNTNYPNFFDYGYRNTHRIEHSTTPGANENVRVLTQVQTESEDTGYNEITHRIEHSSSSGTNENVISQTSQVQTESEKTEDNTVTHRIEHSSTSGTNENVISQTPQVQTESEKTEDNTVTHRIRHSSTSGENENLISQTSQVQTENTGDNTVTHRIEHSNTSGGDGNTKKKEPKNLNKEMENETGEVMIERSPTNDPVGVHSSHVPCRFESNVAASLRRRSPEVIHKCERKICHRGARDRTEYVQMCYFCGKDDSFERYLWIRHLASHAGEYWPQQYEIGEIVMAYLCDLCNDVRFNESDIKKHLKDEHHGDSDNNFKEVVMLRFPGSRTYGNAGRKSNANRARRIKPVDNKAKALASRTRPVEAKLVVAHKRKFRIEEESPIIKNDNPKWHCLNENKLRKICKCSINGSIVNHYVNMHSNSEVVPSRFSPNAARVLRSIKYTPKCRITKSDRPHFEQFCYFCEELHCFTKYFWINHVIQRTGYYQFQCKACSMKFLKCSDHNCKVKHGEHEQVFKRIKQPQFEGTNLNAYICDICNFVRFNKEEIQFHLRNQHENSVMDDFEEVILLTFPHHNASQRIAKPLMEEEELAEASNASSIEKPPELLTTDCDKLITESTVRGDLNLSDEGSRDKESDDMELEEIITSIQMMAKELERKGTEEKEKLMPKKHVETKPTETLANKSATTNLNAWLRDEKRTNDNKLTSATDTEAITTTPNEDETTEVWSDSNSWDSYSD